MWKITARFILRNRTLLLILIGIVTLFMGYEALHVELSYEYAPLLPKKDPASVDYKNFREKFGEEGNVIYVGVEDRDFFRLDHFKHWTQLCKSLSKVEGVENLLSVSNSYKLIKNQEKHKFEVQKIFPDTIQNQEQLDSLSRSFHAQPIYRNNLYNEKSNCYLLAITVNKDKMKTKQREMLISNIQKTCNSFSQNTGIRLHYSGLPYIRVVTAEKIKKELFIFVFLALAICIAILFVFFRTFKAILFPTIIVIIGVIWGVGLLALFGYKITLLSGKIPVLLIVIGISNCIYLLNKYHYEFRIHNNQAKALHRVITRIGKATFLSNVTVAAGFLTFILTSSDILREFGIVASISIMALFALALILIPIFFSYFGPPEERHIRHLENKNLTHVINGLINLSENHRKKVYIGSAITMLICIYGATMVRSGGYMVDDVPTKDPIYKDLKFFESNFDGLMPLEIVINTLKPNGVLNLGTIEKMDELNDSISALPEASSSVSLVTIIKSAKQAFYNGEESYFSVPSSSEKNFILAYAMKGQSKANLLHSFLDDKRQMTRMSFRIKDVGTEKMDKLHKHVLAMINEIFPKEDYQVTVTGSSVISFKGTEYMIGNLLQTVTLALLLISFIMATLFYSWRMVILSLIPNLFPLIFTASVMGFTGIQIKVSTLLIFPIAFGIAVDCTIHYLTRYRFALHFTKGNIGESVSLALKETSISMIYTTAVLFFGFGIFSLSSFGGTVALGVLVSLTVLLGLLANLFLLPSLLLSLEHRLTTKNFVESFSAEDVEE
ncbi:MAG: MMPL family transporter [Bacteroidota bacterium]|nr:MMPL family transporter [Bacteroidota bacterium]MDP4205494.1 MMPL family transporter [Bacteroidota bacterium]